MVTVEDDQEGQTRDADGLADGVVRHLPETVGKMIFAAGRFQPCIQALEGFFLTNEKSTTRSVTLVRSMGKSPLNTAAVALAHTLTW